ncbi:hypothetical protein KUCAC02_020436 [Chaenocephalus aceratus]|nr:hypothetical protein KUCAC02_020436 [Chaenocephalus aceratus]
MGRSRGLHNYNAMLEITTSLNRSSASRRPGSESPSRNDELPGSMPAARWTEQSTAVSISGAPESPAPA